MYMYMVIAVNEKKTLTFFTIIFFLSTSAVSDPTETKITSRNIYP